MVKKILFFTFCMASAFFLIGCDETNKQVKEPTTENTAAYVTNPDNLAMITSLIPLDTLGCLYEMDYTADYKLDDILKAGVSDLESLMNFVAVNLFDSIPQTSPISGYGTGCSMFAATESTSGDKLMGRNYDFCHVENGKEVPIPAIVLKTAPKNGKKAICMLDGYWLGYQRGFYNDGKSDLSMLITAPYTILDGINEDGLAMGVLHLEGNPAIQTDPDKPSIWNTIAMRMIIDKASTVDEAIELLKQYNMSMVSPANGSYHYFLADANGDYAIVEYGYNSVDDFDKNPDKFVVLKGEEHSYVTNFYVDPAIEGDTLLGSGSNHGKARYEILRDKLTMNVYKLTAKEAMELLCAASSKPKPEENTSHTQWSAVYNLSKRTLNFSILQEYEKSYSFTLEK